VDPASHRTSGALLVRDLDDAHAGAAA
jgi:hypothetical protein